MTIDRNCTVALRNAEAGLHIFPCSPATKRPSIHSWRKNSTTDPATIENWWRSRANHLVGIDLHKAGLLVLDGDRHPDENGEIIHDGVEAIRNLLEANGSNAWSNPVVWTPGGGVHIYFRCAAGGFGNAAGNLPDGIDVRGSGGYTIAPGCVLPDRRRYAPAERHPDLAASFRSIPELPGWLAEIIKPKPKPATAAPIPTRQSGKRFDYYAAAALNGMARRLAAMPAETGRNNALNLMAWQMGTMANRGWINRATVEQALFTAAQTLVRDTGPRKVRMTIASGFNAGLQHPHPDLAARR